jgi:hypothetical protein
VGQVHGGGGWVGTLGSDFGAGRLELELEPAPELRLGAAAADDAVR